MSYIKTITVGGVSYELQPKIGPSSTITCVKASVYPYVGSINSDGALAVNLASPTSTIYGLQHIATGPDVGVRGIGVDIGGALGLYVVGGENLDPDVLSRLGRLGFTLSGAMGVYVNGMSGIYVNDGDGCIALKVRTEPVTLQSGEILRIYINSAGELQLVHL